MSFPLRALFYAAWAENAKREHSITTVCHELVKRWGPRDLGWRELEGAVLQGLREYSEPEGRDFGRLQIAGEDVWWRETSSGAGEWYWTEPDWWPDVSTGASA